MNSFKKQFNLETRKAESDRILQKYSDKIPIIVNRGKSNIQDIQKKKFLAPSDLTVMQFLAVLRKRIELKDTEAIFLFINSNGKEIMPVQSSSLDIIYDEHKDEDGFLYFTYTGESVFG